MQLVIMSFVHNNHALTIVTCCVQDSHFMCIHNHAISCTNTNDNKMHQPNNKVRVFYAFPRYYSPIIVIMHFVSHKHVTTIIT